MESALNALILICNYIVVPGLAYGCQLALGALGVTMIYAVLRFSNFGHGEIMSFGTMLVILATFALQSAGLSFAPLPTALLALPAGIIGAIGLCLLLDRYVYKFYRQQRASPVIYLIVSIGTMFIIGGLIRFIIGPQDRNFAIRRFFNCSLNVFLRTLRRFWYACCLNVMHRPSLSSFGVVFSGGLVSCVGLSEGQWQPELSTASGAPS